MCQVRAALSSGFLMELRKGIIEVSNSVQFRKHTRLSNIKRLMHGGKVERL